MQASQIPTKFQIPFGQNASGGNIRTIPVTTTDPDRASQSLGWPPSVFTPEGAGGVPPDGRDFNGLDNMLSAWAQWYSIGGPIAWDSTQSAAIGGYPSGAIVGSVTAPGTYWQSTADNNTTNPDTGGAGWVSWPGSATVPWSAPPPIGNVTPNSGSFTSVTASGGSFINNPSIFYNNLTVEGLLTGGTVINALSDLQINGSGFAHSFTSSGSAGCSGYQKLPGGLIVQFGRLTAPTGIGDTISFPIPFTTNWAMGANIGNDGSNLVEAVNCSYNDLSSFKVWTWKNGSNVTGGFSYVAVGW